MARIRMNITCTKCGETFEHIAFRSNRAACDEYEAWAAQNITVCPACFRAEREAQKTDRAAEILGEYVLPALTGSEKQIVWAEKIRATAIVKMFGENNLFTASLNRLKTVSEDKLHETCQKYMERGYKDFAEDLHRAWVVLHTDSAKWLIDNRASLE